MTGLISKSLGFPLSWVHVEVVNPVHSLTPINGQPLVNILLYKAVKVQLPCSNGGQTIIHNYAPGLLERSCSSWNFPWLPPCIIHVVFSLWFPKASPWFSFLKPTCSIVISVRSFFGFPMKTRASLWVLGNHSLHLSVKCARQPQIVFRPNCWHFCPNLKLTIVLFANRKALLPWWV